VERRGAAEKVRKLEAVREVDAVRKMEAVREVGREADGVR